MWKYSVCRGPLSHSLSSLSFPGWEIALCSIFADAISFHSLTSPFVPICVVSLFLPLYLYDLFDILTLNGLIHNCIKQFVFFVIGPADQVFGSRSVCYRPSAAVRLLAVDLVRFFSAAPVLLLCERERERLFSSQCVHVCIKQREVARVFLSWVTPVLCFMIVWPRSCVSWLCGRNRAIIGGELYYQIRESWSMSCCCGVTKKESHRRCVLTTGPSLDVNCTTNLRILHYLRSNHMPTPSA